MRAAKIDAGIDSYKYELGILSDKSICTMLARYLGMSKRLQMEGLNIRKNEKLPNGTLEIIKMVNRVEHLLKKLFKDSRRRHQIFDQTRKVISKIKIGKRPYVMPSSLRKEYDTFYT